MQQLDLGDGMISLPLILFWRCEYAVRCDAMGCAVMQLSQLIFVCRSCYFERVVHSSHCRLWQGTIIAAGCSIVITSTNYSLLLPYLYRATIYISASSFSCSSFRLNSFRSRVYSCPFLSCFCFCFDWFMCVYYCIASIQCVGLLFFLLDRLFVARERIGSIGLYTMLPPLLLNTFTRPKKHITLFFVFVFVFVSPLLFSSRSHSNQ